MAEICNGYKTTPVKAWIAKLNVIIRGWANYFCTLVSKMGEREVFLFCHKHPKLGIKWQRIKNYTKPTLRFRYYKPCQNKRQ